MSSATIAHIHPSWRCVWGKPLKSWDISIEDVTGNTLFPVRVLCSGCHTELLVVERHQDAKSA